MDIMLEVAINFAAVGHDHDDDDPMPIADSVDDSIVADTHSVEIILAGEFDDTVRPRIGGERKDGLVDADLDLTRQVIDFIPDTRCILNGIVIQRPSSLRSCE